MSGRTCRRCRVYVLVDKRDVKLRLREGRTRLRGLGGEPPRRVPERRRGVPTRRSGRRHGAYDESHAPGAIGFNWETDLQDQTTRDVLDKDDFEDLLGSHGISEDSTVVLYGDNSNWFAAYTYWQFKYYGHEDVHLIDGGREYWVENDYELTDEVPAFSEVDYEAAGPRESIRAYRDDVENAIERELPLVDVRSPEEFSGEILAPPGLQETAQRGGHIPGAQQHLVGGRHQRRRHLQASDELESSTPSTASTATPRHRLLPHRRALLRRVVRPSRTARLRRTINYDGSWTEWGNLVGAPVEKG